MGHRNYYVYMMTNKNRTVLYTGVSNSLERRVWQHKNGTVPGFTKQFNCTLLVYLEEFTEVTDAIARARNRSRAGRARRRKR